METSVPIQETLNHNCFPCHYMSNSHTFQLNALTHYLALCTLSKANNEGLPQQNGILQ